MKRASAVARGAALLMLTLLVIAGSIPPPDALLHDLQFIASAARGTR